MPKDYHKGIKLQVYIPEELDNKINDAIEYVNMDRKKYSRNPDIYNKTKLVKEAIDHYIEHITR